MANPTDQAAWRTTTADSPEGKAIMTCVNLWREAFAAAEAVARRVSPESIDPDALELASTAAAVLAGTFFGNAIIAGMATDQDKRWATETFVKNFRAGIDIGKRQGLRAAASMPVAGTA